MKNEKTLRTVFDEFKEALTACDVDKLGALISDVYQGFSLNGTIENKEMILQAYQPGGVTLSEYSAEDLNFEISGNIGIITGKGSIEGKYDEDEFQHSVLFTDIFKYENERWRYYKSQVTEINSAA